MTAYQRCEHGGKPCPRIYQAARPHGIPPVRLLNLALAAALLWAAIGAWAVSL